LVFARETGRQRNRAVVVAIVVAVIHRVRRVEFCPHVGGTTQADV